MKKSFVGIFLAVFILISSVQSFALSTYEFDEGMKKGIDYYNKGLYYEARDEFQWFCDGNWYNMNDGQQKYVLDYLGATKAKISEWEAKTFFYDGTAVPDFTRVTGRERFDLVRHYDDANIYEYRYRYWNSDQAVEAFENYAQVLNYYGWQINDSYENDAIYIAYFINVHTYDKAAVAFYFEGGYIVSVLIPKFY